MSATNLQMAQQKQKEAIEIILKITIVCVHIKRDREIKQLPKTIYENNSASRTLCTGRKTAKQLNNQSV